VKAEQGGRRPAIVAYLQERIAPRGALVDAEQMTASGCDQAVDCHGELTRQLQKLSLRIDPCATLPLLESAGSYWSVRHGISEDYSEMGSARQDAHPRDCAPDRGVSQHDQEVSADRDS